MSTHDTTNSTDQVDASGVASASHPPLQYRGAALKVVVDEAGRPVVAFDGNSTVMFLGAGYAYHVVDIAWPTRTTDVGNAVDRIRAAVA